MIMSRDCGVRLTVKTENGNFVNSQINLLADNDKILRLAKAVNSLQMDEAISVTKAVTTELYDTSM